MKLLNKFKQVIADIKANIPEMKHEMKDAPVEVWDVKKIKPFLEQTDIGSGMMVDRLIKAETDFAIYVDNEGYIIDGRHRYKKLVDQGVDRIAVQVVGKPHLTLWNHEVPAFK